MTVFVSEKLIKYCHS